MFSLLVLHDRGVRLAVIDYRDARRGDAIPPEDEEPLHWRVESRSSLASEVVAAGQAVVDHIADDGLLQRDDSLDLELINSRIGIVEFNTSGVCASDLKLKITAFLAVPETDRWRLQPAMGQMKEVAEEGFRVRWPVCIRSRRPASRRSRNA